VFEKEEFMNRRSLPPFGKALPLFVAGSIALALCLSPALAQTSEQDQKKAEQEKVVKITEEILVVGKAPKEIPLATVSTLTATEIEGIKPRDLSEVIKYVPGCLVTFGDKDTYSLKLRGIDSKRIALLVDGIPVYEPYFSTFDLKTVSGGGVDTLQVTKGPSSVLYGPNTLGGIVNVITMRPGDRPYLSLTGSLGDARTHSLGLDTSYSWTRFALAANVLYQDSRAFYYHDETEGRTERLNSDFERLNLSGKLYYQPSASTEIMVNGSLYQSEYGMPPALFVQRARYWRFPKWDRSTLNAGGFTSLGGDSFLRFRTYYVNYVNTLDWFNDPEMTDLDSQSTYDNSVYGAFAMAEIATGGAHQFKTSFLAQRDVARIQDDAGLPWEKFDQGTISVGLEDHVSLGDQWKVIGGLSLDYIDKFEGGENNTSLNPLVGVKFTPREELDFHVSFARKSKFPSMRSLYSSSSGNPDLLSESGTSLELSSAYSKGVFLTGSVFFNRFRNFIDSVRLPDGTRRYYNVGEARINGFEIQAQKSLRWLSLTFNYTFVDHRNITDDRPLDAQSKHNANFDASFFPLRGFRIGFNGIYGSESWWYDSFSSTVLSIPAYFNLDAITSYKLSGRYELFVKLGNVFDHYFYTEPGFPWRGRYLEIGVRADVLR
jgi:iron complex outermembrane receptor protein